MSNAGGDRDARVEAAVPLAWRRGLWAHFLMILQCSDP